MRFHSLISTNLTPCQVQWQPCHFFNHQWGIGYLYVTLCRHMLPWRPDRPHRARPQQSHNGGATQSPAGRRGTTVLSHIASPHPLPKALCCYPSQVPFDSCQYPPLWQGKRKEENTEGCVFSSEIQTIVKNHTILQIDLPKLQTTWKETSLTRMIIKEPIPCKQRESQGVQEIPRSLCRTLSPSPKHSQLKACTAG